SIKNSIRTEILISLSLSVTHSHTQTFGSQSLSLHAGLLSPPLQPQPTPDFLAASQNSSRRTSYFPQSSCTFSQPISFSFLPAASLDPCGLPACLPACLPAATSSSRIPT